MSISVTVELNLLQHAEVNAALVRLVSALGANGVTETRTPDAVNAPVSSSRPKPVAVIPQLSDSDRYQNFYDNLPERSRRFLDLVRSRGEVRISEAMAELGVAAAKAMGGITGSIGRWGPARGVPVPYETVTRRGERAWRWIRPDDTEPTEDAEDAEFEPIEMALDIEPETGAPSDLQAADPQVADLQAADPQTVEVLDHSHLPENAQAFIALLERNGTVTMSEALDALGIARAKAMGGVLEPIQRLYRGAEQPVPFEAGTSPTGRSWTWRG